MASLSWTDNIVRLPAEPCLILGGGSRLSQARLLYTDSAAQFPSSPSLCLTQLSRSLALTFLCPSDKQEKGTLLSEGKRHTIGWEGSIGKAGFCACDTISSPLMLTASLPPVPWGNQQATTSKPSSWEDASACYPVTRCHRNPSATCAVFHGSLPNSFKKQQKRLFIKVKTSTARKKKSTLQPNAWAQLWLQWLTATFCL